MGFVAFLNGSVGTWFSLGFYVFAFFAVVAVLARFLSKYASAKDVDSIEQFKQSLKTGNPKNINGLSLRNVKQVDAVWRALPEGHFEEKEKGFNKKINAEQAPTSFAVAQKALYEVRNKRGGLIQPLITKEDIMRPLSPEEAVAFKNFSALAQKNLIETA